MRLILALSLSISGFGLANVASGERADAPPAEAAQRDAADAQPDDAHAHERDAHARE